MLIFLSAILEPPKVLALSKRQLFECLNTLFLFILFSERQEKKYFFRFHIIRFLYVVYSVRYFLKTEITVFYTNWKALPKDYS